MRILPLAYAHVVFVQVKLSVYKLQSETCEGGSIRPRLFLGENLPSRFIEPLKCLGYEIRLLPPYSRLSSPVATHPDMLMCQIGEKNFIPKDYYTLNKEKFEGVKVVAIDADVKEKYPNDVCFNALVMEDCVYGRTDVICKEILESASKSVFVKQGYAACSTLIVSNNAAITADKSIASALTANGVDVCLIEQGNIRLDGYDYGFIGGASLKLADNTVAFFGNIKYHQSFDLISDFLEKYKIRSISLSDEPLIDFGGGKCFLY